MIEYQVTMGGAATICSNGIQLDRVLQDLLQKGVDLATVTITARNTES